MLTPVQGEKGDLKAWGIRLAGVVCALIGGFFALCLGIFVGFGCDEGCQDPGPTIPWRSTEDAWQWDVLGVTALLSLALAIGVLTLACMPRLRPRASIAIGGVQLAAAAVALGLIFVWPDREQEPPPPVITELPNDPVELRHCNGRLCFDQTLRLPEGWVALSRGDPGDPMALQRQYFAQPFGDCELWVSVSDQRLVAGGIGAATAAAEREFKPFRSVALEPKTGRHLLVVPQPLADDGLGSSALIWRAEAARPGTVLLFLSPGILCERNYPREVLDTDTAIREQEEVLRSLAASVHLLRISMDAERSE